MNKGMQFVLHVERRVTLGRRLLFILEPSEIFFTYALTGQLKIPFRLVSDIINVNKKACYNFDIGNFLTWPLVRQAYIYEPSIAAMHSPKLAYRQTMMGHAITRN